MCESNATRSRGVHRYSKPAADRLLGHLPIRGERVNRTPATEAAPARSSKPVVDLRQALSTAEEGGLEPQPSRATLVSTQARSLSGSSSIRQPGWIRTTDPLSPRQVR